MEATGPGAAKRDLISVVVPTRDRPMTLNQALSSILGQRGVALEVIVVDDAPDGSAAAAVVRALADPRVRLVENRGGTGAASCRNTGLAHVTGSWVAFCDDDDLWAPDKLLAQRQAVERERAVWACAGAVGVDLDLRLLHHERVDTARLSELPRFNVVPGGGSGVLARADVVAAAGRFDESLSNSEDWDMWIRIGQQGPGVAVDRPLVAYRIWPGNKSSNIPGLHLSIRRILDRHSPRLGADAAAARWDPFFMRKLTTAGRNRDAAALSLRMARRRRYPKYVLRAAALMVAPGSVGRRDAQHRLSAIPEEWKAEAEAWLAAFRSDGAAIDPASRKLA